MKLLVLVSLVTMALAWEDKNMIQTWQKLKAKESCWGEENMKLTMVTFKKAIAKCGQEDAPELSLPPFRSTYRFVNTLMNGANNMDNRQTNMMWKLMQLMQQSSNKQYTSYSNNDNSMDNQMQKFFMKIMSKIMENERYDSNMPKSYSRDNNNYNSEDMMEVFSSMFGNNDKSNSNNYRQNDPMARMSQFVDMFSKSRSKRQADNTNLDLGDRLVEKLHEKQQVMEDKVGNMTCVLKELGCLNHNNEIDLQGMKEHMKQYTMPSPWFAKRYEELMETCYEMATNLPAQISDNSVITGEKFGTVKMGQIKGFMKCCKKAEDKLCMNHDIKQKIEENFGSLEEILEQTQLTEYELFPLVIQLLHGKEMEYMVDSM